MVGSMADLVAAHQGVMLDTYVNRGLPIAAGEGATLIDGRGRRLLDLTSGYGAAVLGYRHPALTEALARQLDTLHVLHGSFASDVRLEAARALLARAGGGLRRVFWSSSGAEAVEAAVKLAVLATGRRRLVACTGAYHGKTLGALALSGGERYRAPFAPLLADVLRVPYGDGAALAAAVDASTAALVLEPIQGEAGIVVPPAGTLAAARAACDAAGALLVLDEVQTGVGRTGAFLASHHERVTADIVCLGKGLAGGVPAGATLVTEEVGSHAFRGAHSATFGGNPLACAGVAAVLAVLDEAMLAAIAAKGETFISALRALEAPQIVAVRGRGLMVAVELSSGRDRVLRALQRSGVLALPGGDAAVRFLPPYVISTGELLHAAQTLGAVLAAG